MRHPADPPNPIPKHLWPGAGWSNPPLGPEDLRIAPSTEELRMIARMLDEEKLAGQTLVTMRDGSPWLELAVAVPYALDVPGLDMVPRDHPGSEAAVGGRVYRYALWRFTCAAYRVGRDGAVEDDPFLRP